MQRNLQIKATVLLGVLMLMMFHNALPHLPHCHDEASAEELKLYASISEQSQIDLQSDENQCADRNRSIAKPTYPTFQQSHTHHLHDHVNDVYTGSETRVSVDRILAGVFLWDLISYSSPFEANSKLQFDLFKARIYSAPDLSASTLRGPPCFA
ncbi:MAG: hypothetical protein ACI959_000520 [Limisphaerales bacterium]|jgi:hypothetical protein